MKTSKIKVYKSRKNGQFAWRYVAKNGRKMACPGETYHNRADCLKAIAQLKADFANTPIEQ